MKYFNEVSLKELQEHSKKKKDLILSQREDFYKGEGTFEAARQKFAKHRRACQLMELVYKAQEFIY